MKITPTMLRVLKAVEERPECGANYIDSFIFPDARKCKPLRAGQYMGRLCRRGLINKRYEQHKGKRGQLVALTVSYTLTDLAREILRSER
jgi:hypothetical protein